MPVRPRISPIAVAEPSSSLFRIGDGTWTFFGGCEPVYPDRASAERAWRRPGMRRDVWLETDRFSLPAAAEVYDGLTRAGWELLWTKWQHKDFALAPVLAALQKDRAALAAFIRREPRAAHGIDDVFEQVRADFDRVDAEARRRAEYTETYWTAGAPRIMGGGKYGNKPRS
jgi:hypothetical protein